MHNKVAALAPLAAVSGVSGLSAVGTRSLRKHTHVPTDLRGDVFGRLDADGWVPLPRREDRDLIQEFVDSSDKIVAVFSLVGHVVEHLEKKTKREI